MPEENKSVCKQSNFEILFDTHARTLHSFVYYKCGDKQQAEDIVQEAFIKLWDNCAKVIYEKAKSFLYTVANNRFLNEVAHQKVVLKYQLDSTNKTNKETPEYLLEEKEFMDKLQQAIADLPSRQREVFLLSRMEKKTYKEIAEIVGISVKAVEKRMHKALEILRERIGKI